MTEGLEPPTGGDPIRLMRPTLHLRHNICGEGMESNHRHKTFQIFALPTELPHHIWGWEPLCCLKSDTHLLSDSLLGQITFPFSREQHKLEIVKEYPSRSNLNCLIVVLRGLGSGCCFPIPFWIVDIRWMGKTTINIFNISKNLFPYLFYKDM